VTTNIAVRGTNLVCYFIFAVVAIATVNITNILLFLQQIICMTSDLCQIIMPFYLLAKRLIC